MLPTPIARQVQESIRAFLQQMFPTTTEYFRGMVERLTREGNGGLFRGPWYELRLPFESADAGEELPFREISFPYTPHKHQADAFRRLCGDTPQSTLVTTGTGSGKTECFMYPVLDYCARMQREGRRGIKAVFLYPMNALAADQARRLAAAVAGDAALKGVRVGMYVGGEGTNHITMGPDHVITSRNEMRKSPPDILLTNYKMLDYMLLRADDRKLWQHNAGNGVMRYLVVDELHTFDGAQATDLACLIRRLKHRVLPESGSLCCIGTSATIGGENSAEELCDYAGKIFGEPFTVESIIREAMMDSDTFRKGEPCRHSNIPGEEAVEEMQVANIQEKDLWLKTQYRLWFEEEPGDDFQSEPARLALGTRLLGHRFTGELLNLYESAETGTLSETEVHRALVRLEHGLADVNVFRAAMDSFLALCAHALYEHPASGRVQPFLRLHVQLWIRELSHMVTRVLPWDEVDNLKLDFRDTQSRYDAGHSLPLVFCRDCGTMTWGALKPRFGSKLSTDLTGFYSAYFHYGQDVLLLHPVRDGGWRQHDLYDQAVLCGRCMTLTPQQGMKKTEAGRYICPDCKKAEATVPVDVYHPRSRSRRGQTLGMQCPTCGATEMMMVGSRAAGLNSAAISTLYASSCNSDKKLLAFSDNVQDASHRAGFFAGRTYSHTLRAAFRKALQAQEGKTLAELYEHIGGLCCAGLSPAQQICLFMPPDKEWLHDYESFLKNGKVPPSHDGHLSLPQLIHKRLSWEFYSEMTWRAARGRTLERTGCMTLSLPGELIGETARALRNACREHLGESYAVPAESLTQWIVAVLHRLRLMGGVAIPVLEPAYRGQSKSGMYIFQRNNHDWLRGQANTMLPRFFCNGSHDDMLPIHTKTGRETWLENRALRLEWPASHTKSTMADFIDLALKEMVKAGLLKQTRMADMDVWSLAPESLTLSCRVQAMQCSHCCGKIYADPALEGWYTGAPCLKQDCPGHYEKATEGLLQGSRFYNAADIVRIHAAEHTGLLERETRERTEQDFISGHAPVSPNLLSCTPTLEMGIDIGDLSSVLLCSVPPSPANYRQRIGRAGRKDGNAFSLTTANSAPNDLYFFQEPADMVRGEVEAPGVYLDSPAILRRQIFAFALDEWVFRTTEAFIPRKVKDLLRSSQDQHAFPRNFLTYCKRKSGSLGDQFSELLNLPPDTKADLLQYLTRDGEDSLNLALTMHMDALRAELNSYYNRRSKLQEEEEKLKKQLEQGTISPEESKDIQEQIRELAGARHALAVLGNRLRNKETLEYLTDEGLLPNYAFPEEGVTLKTVILKDRRGDNSGGTESHEYMRAAASAITEFAPGSTFYVEGRKMKIDQINVETAERETWHFCPQCSCVAHSRLAGTTCPQCGTDWSDASHQREVLKFSQVLATVQDKKSRSLDDSDVRKPMFYEKGLSVKVKPEDEGDTYLLQTPGNGLAFTFIRHAVFREFNFGQPGSGAVEMQVNGRKIPAGGFRVCAKCGKLMEDDRDFSDPKKHDWNCPHRKRPSSATDDAMFNIFLYREIQSEALRIMLPGACADDDVWRSSFEAVLQLGIKAYFKGRVANLNYTFDSIVLPGPGDSTIRRACMLIYDTVPGGTGNLKELTRDPNTFVKVLQLAMRHIVSCRCTTDPDKDGCHRCMYAFRGYRDIKPSRQVALAILRELGIGESADTVLPIPQKVEGVGTPEVTNAFITSELEKRFVEWLRMQEDFSLEDHVVNGKTGYLLRAGSHTWEIEPQREEMGGSSRKGGTVTDFTFHPLRSALACPIVVYLDGFAYHASAGNNRFSGDIKRREDLRLKHNCLVWTLTWDDIQNDLFNQQYGNAAAPQSLELPCMAWEQLETLQPAQRYRKDCPVDPSLYKTIPTPIRILRHLLANGNDARGKWVNTAALLAMGMGNPKRVKGSCMEQAREAINSGSTGPVAMDGGDGAEYVGYYRQDPPWRMLWQLARADGIRFHNAVTLLSFDSDCADDSPEYQKQWRAFWCVYNFLQVLPHFRATTPELARDGYRCESAEQCAPHENGLTDEMLLGLDDEWKALLRHQPFPEPELFHEVLDDRDMVMDGCVEVAWPEARAGILRKECAGLADSLIQRGWHAYVWGCLAPADLLNQLSKHLREHE